MTQLEECKKAIEQICMRQNDCWHDTKTIATAVYVILTHMIDADRKTEPTGYNLSPVEDEPQFDYCPRCGMRILSKWAKTEPQTEPLQTCSVNGRPYSECSSCEHFRCTADEPQTERSE